MKSQEIMKRHVSVFYGGDDWSQDASRLLLNAFAGNDAIQIERLGPTDDPAVKLWSNSQAPFAGPVFFVGWHRIEPAAVVNGSLCFCVHPSALPQFRGGSPLQHQILAGVEDGAVTVFRMTEGLDEGPIARVAGLSLRGPLTGILERLARIAGELMILVTREWMTTGTVATFPQYGEPATFKRRTPEMSELFYSEIRDTDASTIANKIRALSGPGYPPAFIRTIDGRRLVITEAEACE